MVFITQPEVLWKVYSFQAREMKNTGHTVWDFLNGSRLFLGLGHEKSYQILYTTKESEENSR